MSFSFVVVVRAPVGCRVAADRWGKVVVAGTRLVSPADAGDAGRR